MCTTVVIELADIEYGRHVTQFSVAIRKLSVMLDNICQNTYHEIVTAVIGYEVLKSGQNLN